MGLFGKILGKKDKSAKAPKGFVWVKVKEIKKETPQSVSVSFEIPENELMKFNFIPGQYLTVLLDINGKEERRSYSICSTPYEDLRIGVKEVDKGLVSGYINNTLAIGDEILISHPEGNFKLLKNSGNYVAFAAGSGITPILSIAKTIAKNKGTLNLFYGNRKVEDIMFKADLDALPSDIKTTYFLSGEKTEGYENGRLDSDNISTAIKANLPLLRADGFYLCGPEEMIVAAIDTLKVFGVPDEKIIYELFTTPVLMKSKATEVNAEKYEGIAHVEVELDGEIINFDLDSSSVTILEKLSQLGEDAPYSCKGGVCCTCRAKITEGKATMKMNYSLTDKEVEEGYVLTCQAHPASKTLKLTYDD